ncbi:MAG TPA: Spy/CpxP family protein refolding chaperone [Pyrinomonadaceae bacterium]|nr:Spy/CpxP family protein refolding chaperone [Pyrinomonadaceae bacterium]
MNKFWRKMGLSAVSAALLLIAAVVVWSQQPRAPRPPGQGGFPPPGGFQGGPPDGLQGPPGPGRPGPGRPGGFGAPGIPRQGFGPFGPFGRELNLTDDQRAQIQKIAQSFQQGDQALREQMRTLVEGQGDPLSGEFNEAAVRAAADARAKIQVEMEVSHARMMSQMFGVLTAEQRAQLAAHRNEMRQQGPPPPPPAAPQAPGDQPF